jgi:hypothetical protein
VKPHVTLPVLGLLLGYTCSAEAAPNWQPVPCPKPPTSVAAARRVALVVGVDTGQSDRSLNGAKDVADALRKMGYEVTHQLIDPGKAGLQAAIVSFASAAADASTAVFYFSGHGFQHDGQNFLVTAAGKAAGFRDPVAESLSANVLFDALEEAPDATKIVIIDACRDNPYTGGSEPPGGWKAGLAKPERIPGKSVVLYSAPPGRVAGDGVSGRNTPFTRAVLKHLPTHNISLGTAVERVLSSNLDFDGSVERMSWLEGNPGDVFLRDPVVANLHILDGDDQVLVLVNGAHEVSWPDHTQKDLRPLPGDNPVVIEVYNQHTFRNHNPFLPPEGWHYRLQICSPTGAQIDDIKDLEDPPKKDGPHHGKMFTAGRFTLHLDPDTSTLSVKDFKDWR